MFVYLTIVYLYPFIVLKSEMNYYLNAVTCLDLYKKSNCKYFIKYKKTS